LVLLPRANGLNERCLEDLLDLQRAFCSIMQRVDGMD
jgi:hypothetical protein